MATAPQLVTEFVEITLTVKGIQVRPGLKLLRMPPSTFDFHVDGPERFVLHFTNPKVFGKKVAILEIGSNILTLLTPPTESTPCYVWSETELADILAAREQQPGPRPVERAVTATLPPEPMTKRIIIPPGE